MRCLARLSAPFRRFRDDESGGATVDWVVGTAAGVTLALAVVGDVADGVKVLAAGVGQTLTLMEIPDYTGEGG
jgi:Flp pilus assembly pilin Flp